jgi:Domain of unknown function (DUF202)
MSAGFQAQWQNEDEPRGLLAWWFLNREREHKLDSLDLPLLGGAFQRRGVPPKNAFALERTYLAWIHMAITVGAVAAALVGVAGGSSPRSEKVGHQRHAVLLQLAGGGVPASSVFHGSQCTFWQAEPAAGRQLLGHDLWLKQH